MLNFFRKKKSSTAAGGEASEGNGGDDACEEADEASESLMSAATPSTVMKEDTPSRLVPGLLDDVLSDAAKFSLVAMCSLTVRELFSEPENKKFNTELIKNIVAHLKQPKQVEKTALAFLEGDGTCELAPFAQHLKTEFTTIEKLNISIIPQDLVTLALANGVYDARFRVVIRRITAWLDADWDEVENYEKTLVTWLRAEEHELTDIHIEDGVVVFSHKEEKKEKEEKAKKRKIKRYALIGIATVGGGTLLGLTGGLAAPLLAAGMGTIIGATGATALASTAGVAIIGSLFGAAGAGLGGFKMRKRVGDVEEFDFDVLTDGDDLHVTIAITGWLTNEDSECMNPWLNMINSGEQFCLRFETQYLLDVGNGMDYILTAAVKSAASEALKYTVLSGIIAAVTWPAAILAVSSVIDNPWSVCTQRTEASGKQLAEVLLARQHGQRPVTLVGFSLGARVVFYCLLELAKRKNSVGIVQDAVMLGAPVTGSAKTWSKIGNTVAGRIVNGYCRSDWLLKFLYRSASIQISIAGLGPIEWEDRRMVNLDLTSVVSGHLDYKEKLDELLQVAGIRTQPPKPSVEGDIETKTDELKPELLAIGDAEADDEMGEDSWVNIPDLNQTGDAETKSDILGNVTSENQEGGMQTEEALKGAVPNSSEVVDAHGEETIPNVCCIKSQSQDDMAQDGSPCINSTDDISLPPDGSLQTSTGVTSESSLQSTVPPDGTSQSSMLSENKTASKATSGPFTEGEEAAPDGTLQTSTKVTSDSNLQSTAPLYGTLQSEMLSEGEKASSVTSGVASEGGEAARSGSVEDVNMTLKDEVEDVGQSESHPPTQSANGLTDNVEANLTNKFGMVKVGSPDNAQQSSHDDPTCDTIDDTETDHSSIELILDGDNS